MSAAFLASLCMLSASAPCAESRIDEYLWNRVQHWPLAQWLITAVEASPQGYRPVTIRGDDSPGGDDVVIQVAKSLTVEGCATFSVFFARVSRAETLGPRALRICRDGEKILLEFEPEAGS